MFRSFAMRANVPVVVVFVGLMAHHLAAGPAEGGPWEEAAVASMPEEAVVVDTPPPAAPRLPVNVRVYKSREITDDVLHAALAVAEATFAAASVDIAWKLCGPSECNTPLSPAERMVRLVQSPTGVSQDIRCLGEAMIDVEKGIGVLATVYVDRVLSLVRRLEIDRPTLLGRTIAHEVGHLLLATTAHAVSGLMREVWSPEELLASRAEDWVLRPVEAAVIKQRLTLLPAASPASPRS